jgi:hypothetical protein
MAQSHEEVLAKAREYYERNKDRIRLRRTSDEFRDRERARYHKQHEKHIARAARYREKHRSEINARARQNYKDNPPTGERLQRKKDAEKAWTKRNREWLNEYKRIYESLNRDRINAQRRALYWANDKKRISTRRASNKAVKELKDHYVRYLLKMENAPKELIEVKRELIKLRRLLKNG